MGKKKKKVTTGTGDSGQIKLTESAEVPISTKEESTVPKDETNESTASEELTPQTPGEKETTWDVSEEMSERSPEIMEERLPESTKEPPAQTAKPEDERIDLDQIITEEVAEKPKGKKKAKKAPKKKQVNEQKEAVVAKTEAPENIVLKDLELLDFEDETEEVPNLIESMKAQEAKPREAWKILFSGLDFAGKSSIIATVKNEFEKIVNPQPTKLTERSEFMFLGQSVHDWDMGGQRLYRIQYLKRPMMYYADTSVLFYVIDVLDEERFDESIDFLYDTLQLFDKLNVNPLISILFHKFDPDVERDSKKNRIELKITALTNKIKVLAYGRDILFFRTSIFNKYSVIESFSKTLLELFPDKNLVDYALAELAQKTGANIIIILDENRFILGKNIIESDDIQYDELVKLAQNTLLSFLYLNENFQFYPFLKSNYLIIQLEKYSFLWSQIEENGHSFYIIVFKDGARFDELLKMDVQSVAKTLMKLVKKP